MLSRPTIFIGYSLGGILLKNILIDMNTISRWHFEPRKTNLKAVVFIGTPHFGASIAGAVAFGLLGRASQHVWDLRKNSRFLKETHRKFCDLRKHYYRTLRIASVVETRGPSINSLAYPHRVDARKGIGSVRVPIIVNEKSSVGQFENELVIRAESCHMNLPFFNFPNSSLIEQELLDFILNSMPKAGYSNNLYY
jgi:hypothetical protein